MTTIQKKQAIKDRVENMFIQVEKNLGKQVEKAMNSGAIDIDEWDENHNPMLLPKAILSAILISEVGQFDCRGTSFEKQMKKDIKNLGYIL